MKTNAAVKDFEKLDPGLVELPLDLIRGDEKNDDREDDDKDDRRRGKDTEDLVEEDRDEDLDDRQEKDDEDLDDEDRGSDDREDDRREDYREDDRQERPRRGSESQVVLTLLQQVGGLQSKLDELSRASNARRDESQLSAQQWEEIETKTGLKREAVEFLTRQILQARGMDEQRYAPKLAALERELALGRMSQERGFENIGRYRKEIDKHLEKLPVHLHADPEVLRMAVLAAMGGDRGRVERIRDDSERRRRIVSRLPRRLPSGPSRKGGNGLSALQEHYRKQFGMGVSEYKRLGTGGRNIDR